MISNRPLMRGVASLLACAGLALGLSACGGEDTGADGSPTAAATDLGGLRVASPVDANALLEADGDIIVLDVRTPEEFESGHLEGATMIDFYTADFADRLNTLDKDASYVIYCRSGNRSGQTRAIMADLGFTDVVDIEGGVQAWSKAGLGLTK